MASDTFSKSPPRYSKRAATAERRSAEVVAFFDSITDRTFSQEGLREIFTRHNLVDFHLPISWRMNDFIKSLLDTGLMILIELVPTGQYSDGRSVIRYVWREASDYRLALSLRPRSYLSHATAMFLHALTDQVPKTIFVNREQSPKPDNDSSSLSQASLDRAFKNAARVSNYVFGIRQSRAVLVNGKHSNDFEVGLITHEGEELRATRLERTLLDAAVRPTYAGGVMEVLQAFRRARGRVSGATLLAALRQLQYTYPYHQSIGFYLERAGYDDAVLNRFRTIERRLDFYLDNRIEQPNYDPSWRVFYPKSLD